jgi:hypothetical protein
MISYIPRKKRTILRFEIGKSGSNSPSPDPTSPDFSVYQTQEYQVGDLYISHVIAPGHIESEDAHKLNITDLVKTIRRVYDTQGEDYSFAIVQGMNKYRPAARMIQRTDILTDRHNVEDCFVSPEVIDDSSLHALLSDESNIDKVKAELLQSYQTAAMAYAHKITKTTERCPGYQTAAQHLSNLMDILNNQSAKAIAERLKKEKGRVLIYCLQEFTPAVEKAVSLLGRGD